MTTPDLVTPALDRYVAGTPRAALDDPQHRLHMDWLRQALSLTDQAMRREGIPTYVRDRVINAVVDEALDARAALARLEQHARAVAEEMARQPSQAMADAFMFQREGQ